ncbi:YceI family protein [Streptomyces sp. NBC_00344]|uniref:YceI family protein n=1 Tax=Streptomyces sp. NBC_00344 TaxID=2975720 RepID=UPI002E20B64A
MEPKPDNPPAAPRLGRYAIDTASSTVTFGTRHVFGLLPVNGTFEIRSGTVDVAEPLGASVIRVEIAASSFRTGNPMRDDAVRSARFLDADRHPLITFAADGVDGACVTGTLTAHGVAQPVRLSVEQQSATPRGFTARATARIDRTLFGVTASRGMAGRHLDVSIEVECVRG